MMTAGGAVNGARSCATDGSTSTARRRISTLMGCGSRPVRHGRGSTHIPAAVLETTAAAETLRWSESMTAADVHETKAPSVSLLLRPRSCGSDSGSTASARSYRANAIATCSCRTPTVLTCSRSPTRLSWPRSSRWKSPRWSTSPSTDASLPIPRVVRAATGAPIVEVAADDGRLHLTQGHHGSARDTDGGGGDTACVGDGDRCRDGADECRARRVLPSCRRTHSRLGHAGRSRPRSESCAHRRPGQAWR